MLYDNYESMSSVAAALLVSSSDFWHLKWLINSFDQLKSPFQRANRSYIYLLSKKQGTFSVEGLSSHGKLSGTYKKF